MTIEQKVKALLLVYLPGWWLNASRKNLQDDESTTLWARNRWWPTTNATSVKSA